MHRDSLPIAALRASLAEAVGDTGLVVSAAPRQLYFDEDSAAYAEIDVAHAQPALRFELVVNIGSLPSEAFLVDVWHRYAPEVWLVDPSDACVYVARREAPALRLSGRDRLRPRALPGAAIVVASLFELLS